MIKKAVIPAAGFGTRFLPITKAISKELLPIVDKPVIEFIVDEAIAAGIEEILIVVSDHKKDIITYFTHNEKLEKYLLNKGDKRTYNLIQPNKKAKISFVFQHQQKGLGDAILHAEEFVDGERFAVLLGDDLYSSSPLGAIKELIDVSNKYDGNILGTMKVKLEDTKKYGVLKFDKYEEKKPNLVVDMVEKPEPKKAPSNIAISGRYILDPSIFKYLKTQSPGKGGEIQLTDALKRSLDKISTYSLILSAKRYDVGSKEGYIEAFSDFIKNMKL